MMDSNLTDQFGFLLLSFLAYIMGMSSPGPNILAILATSISYGKRSVVTLAPGIVTGSVFWGIFSIFGITFLLLQFSSALFVLQICGALYLIYLSYKSFKSALSSNFNVLERDIRSTLAQRYLEGLLVQVTNPKSAITLLAVYSIALTKTASLNIALTVVLGNLFLSLIIHIRYATLFSGNIVRAFLIKNRKIIQLVISLFFIILARLLLFAKIGVT